MKTAEISAIPAGEAPGYAWTWRCSADNRASKSAFTFYYDCVMDAKKHGYEVDLVKPLGATAPGGAGFRLSGTGD